MQSGLTTFEQMTTRLDEDVRRRHPDTIESGVEGECRELGEVPLGVDLGWAGFVSLSLMRSWRPHDVGG